MPFVYSYKVACTLTFVKVCLQYCGSFGELSLVAFILLSQTPTRAITVHGFGKALTRTCTVPFADALSVDNNSIWLWKLAVNFIALSKVVVSSVF